MEKKKSSHESANLIPKSELDFLKLTANTVRGLSMDGVQKANSGHPGLPMGMANAAVVLWQRHLKHNPKDPRWPNRDRFVLSAGHGSMLLYSLLHLNGYDLPLSELKSFRQWESRTPGHPEHGLTPGVETTTGPLGQGISNAVGMALAERWLAERYNRKGFEIVDHHTFVIASDGEMMEGVPHESCALAAHLKLGKLIVLYDNNKISIDGSTDLAFTEDVMKRFSAYGWHTQDIDGLDMNEVEAAIASAKAETSRPSIISCRTIIGYSSPHKAGTAEAHGSPLGADEVRLTKKQLGWPEEPDFYIPQEVAALKRSTPEKGKQRQSEWEGLLENYRKAFPQLFEEFSQAMKNELPKGWDAAMPEFSPGIPLATRAASGKVLDAISPRIPQLIGGSADLTPSNNTFPKNETALTPGDFSGRYIHFGVREHGMAAIMSGMALHGGVIPYGGTFLIFSDYMRPSMRLAALMEQRVIYVFTHDSIGLGEDGPTHQPIEQLTALRAIPNLTVIRPADAAETVEAWKVALHRNNGPTALILTRQKLPVYDRKANGYAGASNTAKGGYAMVSREKPDVILIGIGSELQFAVEAGKMLEEKGIMAQVVSMPSCELFDAQPESYRETVLPSNVRARVAIEAGATLGWYKYAGDYGEIVGIDHFGASAPYQEIYKGFGLTTEAVVEAALRVIEKMKK